jgi:hypothetical protein
MAPVPLRWTENAKNVIAAIRQATDYRGFIWLADALMQILYVAPPGESILARALRDPDVWPGVHNFVTQEQDEGSKGQGFNRLDFELNVEDLARNEKARHVGERHISQRLMGINRNYLEQRGLRVDRLERYVREAELGPEFPAEEINDRWHGLLDANIIIECRMLAEIKWQEEVDAKSVVLWVGGSLLDELDRLRYERRDSRVGKRVRTFYRWLSENGGRRFDEALNTQGTAVRAGVRLRIWAPLEVTEANDTGHLETALMLRERGVPITVVSQDYGMQARARYCGLPAHALSDKWLLSVDRPPDEPVN